MKLLVVSFWCPDPPDNGSRLRAYHLIQNLVERGYEIKLLALAQEETDIDSAERNLGILCSRGVELFPSRFFRPTTVKAAAGFFSPRPRHLLDTHQPEFAAVVARECRSGDHDAVLTLELGAAHYVPRDTPLPCVLDQLEVSPFVKAVQNAGSARERLRRSLTLAKQKSHVASLARRYARWMTVSEAEADSVRRLVGPSAPPIQVLPNGVDLRRNAFDADASYEMDTLVYNGALSFWANAEAVRWFVEEVFPLIRHDRPQARLRVTGRTTGIGADDALRAAPGVVLTGFLDDVRPAVREAAVCVVPLRAGGGTRLKILEAMALGVPVVATARGAEGLDVTDGINIIIADTPLAFAAATVGLMNDPTRRAALGAAGRRLVESRYGWDAIVGQLHETLEALQSART